MVTLRYAGNGAENLGAAVHSVTRSAASAPIISVTATGPIRLERGKLYAAPAGVALSLMQNLHHQAAATPRRPVLRPYAIAELSREQAFALYSNAVVANLAQLALGNTSDRILQLSAMLDFVDASGDLGGLEGPFLSGVLAAQQAGATDLVDRAQQQWDGIAMGSSIGGGAVTVPVIDAATGQLALLDKNDLIALGAGRLAGRRPGSRGTLQVIGQQLLALAARSRSQRASGG